MTTNHTPPSTQHRWRRRVGSIGRGVESLRFAAQLARRRRGVQAAGMAALGVADLAGWAASRAGAIAAAGAVLAAAGCLYLAYVTGVAVVATVRAGAA